LKDNQLQLFNYKDKEIRTIQDDQDETWWIAKDVCEVLDIQNTSDSLNKLDKDEKLISVLSISGQKRETWLINEPGLYTLILRSNKPESKDFKRWITHEVLPMIRKHGLYAMDELLNNPEVLQKTVNKLVEVTKAKIKAEKENVKLQADNNKMLPKAKVYDTFIKADNDEPIGIFAKKIHKQFPNIGGRNKFYKYLREHHIMFKESNCNIPYQQYINQGYFSVINTIKEIKDGKFLNFPKTLITPKGQSWIVKLLNKQGE